jgi:hypothetical protein
MIRLLALVALLAAFARPAAAQSITVDGITVHYAALQASGLEPEVAQPLGILRSDKVVVIQVAVRTGAPGHEQVVPAQVDVRVTDARGALPTPRMRAVADRFGDYHLGEVRIDGATTLSFTVEVRIAGRALPIRAVFEREFFAEPTR